jgi:type II secretory pathway component HofQ
MRERGTALAVAVGLALAGLACASSESKVVDQYFNALRANDQNTLTSFAMVAFDQKVDDWKIVGEGPEVKAPAALPDLVKKQKELQAELDKNTRDARAWGNDLNVYPKLDQVRQAQQKGTKFPAALQPIADKWDNFQSEDRRLKKAVAEAKAAVEREKRNVSLSISIGQVDDVESLTGEMLSRDIDLNLTIGGAVKPYTMTLRRYDLKGQSGGGRIMSRWVIQSLTPKG